MCESTETPGRRGWDDLAQDKPRCYVASPLGFSEAGRFWYHNVLLPALTFHVEIVDPWQNTSDDQIAQAFAEGREEELWLDLGKRNFESIDSCEMLVAVLDGEPPDNGTVAEIAWAAKGGLTVIGYRNDLRQSGENGVIVNLMVPAAIQHSGGEIVTDLASLSESVRDTAARLQAARGRELSTTSVEARSRA